MPRPNLTDFATILDNENMAPLFDLAWGAFKVPDEDAVAKSPAEAREALELYTQSEVNEALSDKVDKSGDTMTGQLVLTNGPILDEHAARKKYVDGEIAKIKNTLTPSQNGWWRDSSTGFMLQWGLVAGAANSVVSITFPLAFPSFCAGVNCASNHLDWWLTVPVYQYTLTTASARTIGAADGVLDQFRPVGPLNITYIAYGW